MFKTFKVEVETKPNERIKKNIKSNYGGKYYGRLDGSSEQRHGPFARYLKEYEIAPHYTVSGSPCMNGVVERLNMTLKHMVRSMISHSTLPESL